MWRRHFLGRWTRRPTAVRRTRLIPYSYGATVLLVGGAILLILYLLGYLSF